MVGKALVPVDTQDAQEVRERHPKVTERQRELVDTLVSEGCSIGEAARRLGASRPWASHTLKKQHVKDYAQDMRETVMGALQLRAVATAHELLSTGTNRQKLELVQTILGTMGTPDSGSQAPAVNIKIDLGE